MQYSAPGQVTPILSSVNPIGIRWDGTRASAARRRHLTVQSENQGHFADVCTISTTITKSALSQVTKKLSQAKT